jgi:hypothetical protein
VGISRLGAIGVEGSIGLDGGLELFGQTAVAWCRYGDGGGRLAPVDMEIIGSKEMEPGAVRLLNVGLGRALLAIAIASVLMPVIACGGGGSGSKASPGASAPASSAGSPAYPQLADGQYIDSLPAVSGVPLSSSPVALPQLAAVADEIAVLEVTGVVGIVVPTAGPGSATPSKRISQPLPWTTYNVHVDQWIKGDGPADTTVITIGGIDHDGPRLFDGTFLLQAGRKYLMPLRASTPQTPGSAKYEGASTGWASVEVTDGAVHVLNDARSRGLLGQYEGMKLGDIIAEVKQWIVSPPSPVTHSPSPSG